VIQNLSYYNNNRASALCTALETPLSTSAWYAEKPRNRNLRRFWHYQNLTVSTKAIDVVAWKKAVTEISENNPQKLSSNNADTKYKSFSIFGKIQGQN